VKFSFSPDICCTIPFFPVQSYSLPEFVSDMMKIGMWGMRAMEHPAPRNVKKLEMVDFLAG
jgi:hypothetical protein